MEEKGGTKTGIAYYDENGLVQSVSETTGKPRSELEKNLTEVEFKYNNLDDMFDKAQTAATAHKDLLANPPPSMGSPEQIAEAKEFAKKRAAEQKPTQPPEKKSGTATVYYSATGDIDGVSFDGKHYMNENSDSDHPILVSAPIAVRAEISKEFQFTNITPHKLLQELASKAQETVNNADKQQAPQPPAERERQLSKSSVAPGQPQQATTPTTTPPLVNPAKGRRGLPGKLSAKPTYDPNALKKTQSPQPVVQQKVAPQPASQQQPKAPTQETEYTAYYNTENGKLLGINMGSGNYLSEDPNNDNAPMKYSPVVPQGTSHSQVNFSFKGDILEGNVDENALKQKARESVKKHMDARPQREQAEREKKSTENQKRAVREQAEQAREIAERPAREKAAEQHKQSVAAQCQKVMSALQDASQTTNPDFAPVRREIIKLQGLVRGRDVPDEIEMRIEKIDDKNNFYQNMVNYWDKLPLNNRSDDIVRAWVGQIFDKTADGKLPKPSVTPEQQQPAVAKQSSGVNAQSELTVPNNKYYNSLDKKFADINSALKDCTLVKENGTYHIKNATTKSDIAINRDGSMRGELHTVNNQDDSKAIADKISADLVAMAKVHQASGSKEPFHLVVTKSENLSEAQELKVMQIERLVQHNLEREFNAGNKNGLDKSNFTFAGKPIPPPAPSPPVEQKIAISARGSTTPKRDEIARPGR